MVIIRLLGGLGNQLFQFALGRYLALRKRVPLMVDLAWFEKQDLRKFELDKFNLKFEIASDNEVYSTRYLINNRLLRKVFTIIQGHLPYYRRRYIKEQQFGIYDSNILLCPRNCYLSGYWQSEKYFAEISSLLRQEFTPKFMLSAVYKYWQQRVSEDNSVSIHIRRGDYVNNSRTNDVHGVCSLEYYLRAIKLMHSKVQAPTFFVFSDDLDWAKRNLSNCANLEYVKVDSANRDQEELLLMSACSHHIIANSSYSWWGAWLGEKEKSIVIAPDRWFSTKPFPQDTIPNRWIKL